MHKTYDVVVVGSGFGGSAVACRLAQAGRSVCILERGKRWQKGEFPRQTLEVVRRGFWNEKKSYGLLDYRTFDGVEVIQGAGVGGGSLHYFNVNLRADEEVIFASGRWPAALEHGILDPYYAVVEEMFQSRPITPPPGRSLPPRTEAFLQLAGAAGASPWRIPLAVKFQPTSYQTTPPSEAPAQQTCDYRGDCLMGCNRFAKHTTDLNYLRLAEQKYGAEIRPLSQAYNIEPLDAGYRIHYKRFHPRRVGEYACRTVMGRKIVVAAGTLGSTELLLRSRDRYRALPLISPMLGKHFSTNGDYMFAGALMKQPVIPTTGPSITAGADFSRAGDGVFVEDLALPDALRILLKTTVHRNVRLFNFLRRLVAARAGNPIERQQPTRASGVSAKKGETGRERGSVDHLLPLLAMGMDAGDGVMSLQGNAFDLQWNPAGSADLFRRMRGVFQELCRRAGAEFRESLWLQSTPKRMLTAHPLGGCVMGDHPGNSVVDHRGQVWGYRDLYVADGAIVPSALAINPSLTICTLAERIAFWMVHRREMQPGDPQTPCNA